MRRAIAATAALLAISGIACGGGLTEEEYVAEVNAICTDAADFLETLPQRAADEDLDNEAVAMLAGEKGEEVEAAFQELDPPGELADAQERLLTLGTEAPPQPTDPAAVAYYEKFRDVYIEIGAEECVANQQETIDQLEELQNDALSP